MDAEISHFNKKKRRKEAGAAGWFVMDPLAWSLCTSSSDCSLAEVPP